MTSNGLRGICLKRFGKDKGIRLYSAMKELKKKGFCVASAWEENEISIARSCETNGVIFFISEDYRKICTPRGRGYDIKGLRYEQLTKYLPRRNIHGTETRNCALDDRVMKEESA